MWVIQHMLPLESVVAKDSHTYEEVKVEILNHEVGMLRKNKFTLL